MDFTQLDVRFVRGRHFISGYLNNDYLTAHATAHRIDCTLSDETGYDRSTFWLEEVSGNFYPFYYHLDIHDRHKMLIEELCDGLNGELWGPKDA